MSASLAVSDASRHPPPAYRVDHRSAYLAPSL